jgi:hypothetical protein
LITEVDDVVVILGEEKMDYVVDATGWVLEE